MKKVEIIFKDHSSEANESWQSIDSINIEVPLISVIGYIAKEDEEALYLVQAHGDNEYRNLFSVVKSAIVEIRHWKEKKSRKKA